MVMTGIWAEMAGQYYSISMEGGGLGGARCLASLTGVVGSGVWGREFQKAGSRG